jgi:hypothetical protein
MKGLISLLSLAGGPELAVSGGENEKEISTLVIVFP